MHRVSALMSSSRLFIWPPMLISNMSLARNVTNNLTLTVLSEKSSLTDRSYSGSCLTDRGRRNKGKENKCLQALLSSRCLFQCEVKGGSEGLAD